MTAALTLFFISIVLLVGFLILLHVEARRGVRFFPDARAWLDATYERFALRMRPFGLSLRRHVVRQTAHYLIHLLFVLCSRFFRWVSRHFDGLIRANKALSRRAMPHAGKKDTRLSAALAHKKSSALSEEERRTHKERAIGTKL